MVPRHVNDVPTRARRASKGGAIPVHFDAVLDDLDPASREAIVAAQALRTEVTARCHCVGEAVEHEPIHGSPFGRNRVRIVPTVLGQD